MRIGIIGAGNVGVTLGSGWANAGHEVVYGVRDAGRPAPHVGARFDSVRAAVAFADVVALVTPWNAVDNALAAAGDFAAKPLIDVTNPIGPGLVLTHGHTTSGAEHVASLAKNARVVKAFNSTGVENMANPRYGDARVVMPIAGDDPSAVETVARLASDLGFEPVALKGLAHARELEPLAMLWIKLAVQWGHGRNIGFVVSRRAAGEGRPEPKKAHRASSVVVVGTGNIGGALAKAWLRSGQRVRVAVRDSAAPEVRALVALGAEATPVAGAAEGADVVVFAIPAGAVVETAKAMGRFEGKVVVDCTNAIGKGFTLVHGHTTSSSEELAKALPDAKVVRAFNQQGAEVLQNPVVHGRAATNFVAGNDPDARAIVRDLSLEVGLDTVEVGPLASARYLEPMTLLWVALSQALGTREFALSLARR